jgi:hypothetical protein
MQILLPRFAITKARQKKLLEDTNKACGTLQNELYNAKDEKEKVLFHNENITHSDDQIFLDSGTRCSLKHDIQTFSYPTT